MPCHVADSAMEMGFAPPVECLAAVCKDWKKPDFLGLEDALPAFLMAAQEQRLPDARKGRVAAGYYNRIAAAVNWDAGIVSDPYRFFLAFFCLFHAVFSYICDCCQLFSLNIKKIQYISLTFSSTGLYYILKQTEKMQKKRTPG